MTQIKRGAALLLCLCMALSLCACGGKGGTDGDVDPDGIPPERDTAAPSSDGTLPLSQYIQSSETKILYEADELAKDECPWIYIFQNGTVIAPKRSNLSFGELSKMSDEEVIQAVMNLEEAPHSEPCKVYLRSDKTGNAVEGEVLVIYDPQTQDNTNREFRGIYPESGEIYDAVYTGYYNSGNESFFVARGEETPFTLDAIDAEGVEVDPPKLDTSFAWIELIDGTQVPIPETCEEGEFISCKMTGDGRAPLSLDDIQLRFPSRNPPFDLSPSVLQTAEGRTALASGEWFSEFYGGPGSAIPAHKSIVLRDWSGNSVRFYNASDTEQGLQNWTLGRISITEPLDLEGRTGDFELDYDFLIQEYGVPSGAVMQWEEVHHSGYAYPTASIRYYWTGDGFYMWASSSAFGYMKSGLNEQDLISMVEREGESGYDESTLRFYEELNRLTSN